MADVNFFEDEKPSQQEGSASLLKIINTVHDFQQQIFIWHLNSKGHYHTATDEAYKALQGILDGLGEAYIGETGNLYEKGDYPKFTAAFSPEKATALSKKFIGILNGAAEKCNDEGIKGYFGDAINTVRSMYFKF